MKVNLEPNWFILRPLTNLISKFNYAMGSNSINHVHNYIKNNKYYEKVNKTMIRIWSENPIIALLHGRWRVAHYMVKDMAWVMYLVGYRFDIWHKVCGEVLSLQFPLILIMCQYVRLNIGRNWMRSFPGLLECENLWGMHAETIRGAPGMTRESSYS